MVAEHDMAESTVRAMHRTLKNFILPVFVKKCNAFHSSEELFQEVTLIGRVDGIPFEPESHQEGIDAENLLNLRQNSDTAAAPGRNRLHSVNL